MRKKVLLMGKGNAGKTSMRSIIFANYIPKDTRQLGPTFDVEHSNVRVMGDLVLNIWDCGGQEAFMDNYFISQRDSIFRSVEVLVYVFDVESRGDELQNDLKYYQMCLNALLEHSPTAKVFCLVHKMDLEHENQRDLIYNERETAIVTMSTPKMCTCFKTSIWDETLYEAWSSIMHQLVPNVRELGQSLKRFAEIMECNEVLVLERTTFLVIAHFERIKHPDRHRFEKVSNIIKKFKLSCLNKTGSLFKDIEVKNSNFTAYIDLLTPNSYIMVIMCDPQITSAAAWLNIKNAKSHFGKYDRTSRDGQIYSGDGGGCGSSSQQI